MGKIVKSSDLTKLEGDPGPRAEVSRKRERVKVRLTLPTWAGGSKLEITTRTRSGLVMLCSIATLLLVVSGCVAGGAVIAAGTPAWAAVAAGLVIPPAYFTLLYLLFRRNR